LRQGQNWSPSDNRTVRLTRALGRLVQLYDAWGKKDRADHWRKEREALRTARAVAAR
jgi:hypothetical protein